MPGPIFHRDGRHVVPTSLARGPWDPGSCHGGAPAALLAATIDTTPALAPMRTLRLSFDLLRPVPLEALRLDHHVVREGKRVQLLDAWLTDRHGTELMRCRALRIRTADLDLPPATQLELGEVPTPGPADLARFEGGGPWTTEGFWQAVDVRFVTGTLGEPGPGAAWFRVVAPLLDGLPITPVARVAAAADFGNGISSPLPMGPYLFVNPDLTVHLSRLPQGEWIGMRSSSVADPSGTGLTTSALFDETGVLGSAAQSLFVDAMP
jgi:hypothetical protein